MISRPMPPRVPVEISATIAPTTAAAAASFSAGTRYGTAAGSRSFTQRLPAAGGVGVHQLDRRRRRRLQAAQRADGDREEGEVRGDDRDRHPRLPRRWPKTDSWPPQPTTSGASATSGTVWDRITYGSRPRSARRNRCMSDGEAAGRRATPMTKPTMATPEREPRRPRSTTWPTVRLGPGSSGSPKRLSDVPHVRHRRVVGAGRQVERRGPCRRSPGRAPCSPPTAARPAASDASDAEQRSPHPPLTAVDAPLDLAVTWSATAGMTCSP